MNEFLRDRLLRRLEALPEERVYQVLDYLEFLESKYAQRRATEPNVVQKLAEGVQDTLRASNASAQTIAETMGLMSKAMGVLSGVRAAAGSLASDAAGAVKRASAPVSATGSTGSPPGESGGGAATPPAAPTS